MQVCFQSRRWLESLERSVRRTGLPLEPKLPPTGQSAIHNCSPRLCGRYLASQVESMLTTGLADVRRVCARAKGHALGTSDRPSPLMAGAAFPDRPQHCSSLVPLVRRQAHANNPAAWSWWVEQGGWRYWLHNLQVVQSARLTTSVQARSHTLARRPPMRPSVP